MNHLFFHIVFNIIFICFEKSNDHLNFRFINPVNKSNKYFYHFYQVHLIQLIKAQLQIIKYPFIKF